MNLTDHSRRDLKTITLNVGSLNDMIFVFTEKL